VLASLEQKDLYSVKRMTSHPAVIANLQYYVKPDFGTRTGRELYKVCLWLPAWNPCCAVSSSCDLK